MKGTKRYCKSCEKVTKFEYNRAIDHSECTECGWHSVNPDAYLNGKLRVGKRFKGG